MSTPPSALVELRVLDGANLYFPRAAVKLTVDISALLRQDMPSAAQLADGLDLSARPGPPDSSLRQRFSATVVARIVRRVAAEAGTTRLAVRSRPTAERHLLVVAYPWRRRGKAEALGHGVAAVLDELAAGGPGGLLPAITAAADGVRRAGAGPPPPTRRPHVPLVAVTGTNGKTTTSRLIARMGQAAGLVVGWSSTDGVYVDGQLVEAGDYSGPGGAGRVLDDPRVQLAVTETARGGLLLRGLGVSHNDVAVVTNVSADHLGLQGVDTVDQLAEVKAVITRVTRPGGAVVLNGDDPRTFAMRLGTKARPVVFSRDPASPSLRRALDEGGRGVTVLDGQVAVLGAGGEVDLLLPVVDIPTTLAGLSHVNLENALAAVGAGLSIGLPREAVTGGLRSFRPGAEDNPGRMNVYDLGRRTVVVDLAHNEAGLHALLEVLRGLRAPGCLVHLVLGGVGDRTDEVLRGIGEIGARGADRVVIAHKEKYLRGRTTAELEALMREGAAMVGVTEVPALPTELAAVQALLGDASPGDVVGVMCHAEREAVDRWLREQGATVDGPGQIRDKVTAAAGGS